MFLSNASISLYDGNPKRFHILSGNAYYSAIRFVTLLLPYYIRLK